MNRRQFIRTGAGAAALLALHRNAYGYAFSPRVQKFQSKLRQFGLDIKLATPDTTTYPGVDYYQIEAGEYRERLAPDLYAPGADGTRLYGYRQAGGTFTHLGTPILATRYRPVRVKFSCKLPSSHILPFDASVPQGMSTPTQNRAAIHLHGGLVPWTSDGGPFHWTDTDDVDGASVEPWLPGPDSDDTTDYWYPNNQSARFMWYHDHAIGITRLNAYAGIATGYLVQDEYDGLVPTGSLGLPFPGEILVVQDKVFFDPLIDPGYTGPVPGALKGDLWYPHIYDPKIWKLLNGKLPIVGASCVAEMFGDTMLVNGNPYPYVDVGGMMRFKLLNACNARFLNLTLAVENPKNPGEPKLSNQGVPLWPPVKVWQIGTECGFLPSPVLLADTVTPAPTPPTPLLLAPAERADIVIDFSKVAAGTKIILYNDAPAPFPGGSPLFDFASGMPNTKNGYGPNTRTLLQLRVGGPSINVNPLAIVKPGAFSPTMSFPVELLPTTRDAVTGALTLALAPGEKYTKEGVGYTFTGNQQDLTLNEAFDQYGRLAQLIGNVSSPAGMFGSNYIETGGEAVTYGTIEIWRVFNLTADTHPMHFHLFNVMVLQRQPFKVNGFNGNPSWTGPAIGPDPNEFGWKETVRMNPGQCTTLAILVENPFYLPAEKTGNGVYGDPGNRSYTFDVQSGSTLKSETAVVPPSPRTGRDEYVWHCHILEHEEHDMMHSLNGG